MSPGVALEKKKLPFESGGKGERSINGDGDVGTEGWDAERINKPLARVLWRWKPGSQSVGQWQHVAVALGGQSITPGKLCVPWYHSLLHVVARIGSGRCSKN
jgi:hypothetical protein